MAQTRRTEDSTDLEEFRSPAESLAAALAFVRRHLTIMSLAFLVTVGGATLYLATATQTYTATSKLVIDAKAPPIDAASASTMVESQIAIIKSEGLARAVIRKLGLAEDAEFGAPSGGLRGTIKSILRMFGLMEPETEFDVMRRALRSFDRRLSAKRVGLTYIIEITFDSADPQRAAKILNTIGETHIAAQMEAKFKSGLGEEKWVKDRIAELSIKASAAQKAVTEYQAGGAGKSSSQSPANAQGSLRELEAAAETSTKAYENFVRMLRYMEAQQQSSNTEAHLLIEASRPLEASSPKPLIVFGISIVGGLFLGIALGMLRDLFVRDILVVGDATRVPSGGACEPAQPAVVNQNYPLAVLSRLRRQDARDEPGALGVQGGFRRGPDA